MYFRTFTDDGGRYRWELLSGGVLIAVSPRGHVQYTDCIATINLVKSTDENTPVYEHVPIDER